MNKPTVDIYGGIAAGVDKSAGFTVILCMGVHRKEFFGWQSGIPAREMALSAILDGLERLTMPCRVIFHAAHPAFALVFNTMGKLEQEWSNSTGFGDRKSDVGQLLGQLQIHQVEFVQEEETQKVVTEATEKARMVALQGNAICRFLSDLVCCVNPIPDAPTDQSPTQAPPPYSDEAYQAWLRDPFSSPPPGRQSRRVFSQSR